MSLVKDLKAADGRLSSGDAERLVRIFRGVERSELVSARKALDAFSLYLNRHLRSPSPGTKQRNRDWDAFMAEFARHSEAFPRPPHMAPSLEE